MFQKARKALAEGVGELAQQMGVEVRPTAAPSSRPTSGASSTGSAASAASKPGLSIPDGSAAPASALHTPQEQVLRGIRDRRAPNAERQVAQVGGDSMMPPGEEQAGAPGDDDPESEQGRKFGRPARLQQHAKQPAVASVMANASASQIVAPGFPSAATMQEAGDAKDAPAQVPIWSLVLLQHRIRQRCRCLLGNESTRRLQEEGSSFRPASGSRADMCSPTN